MDLANLDQNIAQYNDTIDACVALINESEMSTTEMLMKISTHFMHVSQESLAIILAQALIRLSDRVVSIDDLPTL